jgi:multiple sugar transport system substrate-binding protein
MIPPFLFVLYRKRFRKEESAVKRPSRISALVAAVLGAALLTAGAAARPDADAVTLKFWIMNNGAKPVEDMERILQPFERQTGINVDVQLVGWDVQFQRITNAALSGEAPDVTQAGTTQVAYFASLNGFENLTARVGQIGGRGAYPGGVWTTSQVVGRPGVWGVPWFSEARTIYYRTDIFKAAKIDPNKAFRTWDSFRATLDRLSKVKYFGGRRVHPLGQPGKTAWDLVHHVMPFVWSAGGAELTADSSASAIASPRAVTGVKYFADLVNKGWVMRAGLEMNAPQVENLWKAGQLATWIGGPWVVAAAARKDDTNWADVARNNFAVAQMPAGPTGKSYTFAGGSNLMLFKYSQHKNEAWQLISFLSQPSIQLEYAKLQGMLPARTTPQKSLAKGNNKWDAFYQALGRGRTYAPIPAWGAIEGAYKTHFGNILDIAAGQGKTSYSRSAVVAELRAAEREANALIEQSR